MKENKHTNLLLFRIAAPIAVQGVVSATLTMVDNLMVGVLGETELAAVGVGSQIFMVHYLLLFGVMSGSATFLAQFYGTRDMANIRKVIGFDFAVLGVLGLFFFALVNLFTGTIIRIYTGDPAVQELASLYVRINSVSFLLLAVSSPLEMAFKATQQVRIPMVISMSVFVSNVLLNYILIFGKFGLPALGVAGAAIGTAVSRVIELTLNLIFANRRGNSFRGSIRSYFGWDPELIRRIIKNATPTTLNEFLWGFGQSMFVAAFNRIGTTAYAAYQAANSIFNIFNFAAFSLGDASLILLGEQLGEGNKAKAWSLSKHILKVTVIVSLAVGLVTIALSGPLSEVFRLTEEGGMYARYVLIVFGATMFLDMLTGVLISGVLRSGGDTRFTMFVESGFIWLYAVPLAFIAVLVWHLPVHLALLVIRTELVLKAVVLTRRYISRKWMNTVIEDL